MGRFGMADCLLDMSTLLLSLSNIDHLLALAEMSEIALIGLAIGLGLLIALQIRRFIRKPFILVNGYVIEVATGESQHRIVAKRILRRDLHPEEVVHHINGKRADNRVHNLCVMAKIKHETFHAWLRWKKQKSGSYPSISYQKKVLVQEYNGILLERVTLSTPQNQIRTLHDGEPSNFESDLFEELRKERKRLADERGLPAYAILHNKTLHEMCRLTPTSEVELLKIISQEKMRLYGSHFLKVIQSHKKPA